MELSIYEQISYSTIRIECQNTDSRLCTGTGFFFNFLQDDIKNQNIPVIITNKHVVNNAQSGTLIFTKKDANGRPIDKEHFRIKLINYRDSWVYHPDRDVDLCALPIAAILREAERKSEALFYMAFDMSLLPDDEQLNQLSAMEDIIMIGYPNGLWDEINNKPIFRKGITATNLLFDYNGKKEFVIDAACFPGSSGSPIMIINEGNYRDKKGNLYVGSSRVYLLGILYTGPQYTATGEIKVVKVPTADIPISLSRIPNNLGYVIKSDRIRELENLFRQNK